jgi:predicted transcriptional regulator
MPIREKGTTLAAQLIPQVLANAATTFVDSLKLSSVSEEVRRGRQVVLKRRQIYGDQLAELANLYFRVSNIPIRFWSKVEDWKRWEEKCFQMLNGDRFRLFPSRAKTVSVEKLPGESLWDHIKRRTLTRQMPVAAGRELFRAHQFWSDEFGGPWSHGDSTTTNVIYDEMTDRARLIDFEIIHHKSLPAKTRHADDLLVFLLDILAIVPSRQWLPFALSFVNAYGDAEVIGELKNQLAVPNGMAWIWWGVRTNFSKPARIRRRLDKLRNAIDKVESYRAVPAIRARQRRRSSISCHAITAGMPIAKSRKRAIKEMAKAVSPGM